MSRSRMPNAVRPGSVIGFLFLKRDAILSGMRPDLSPGSLFEPRFDAEGSRIDDCPLVVTQQHPVVQSNAGSVVGDRGHCLFVEDLVDRKNVVSGRGVAVRVDLGGCRFLKKKKKNY